MERAEDFPSRVSGDKKASKQDQMLCIAMLGHAIPTLVSSAQHRLKHIRTNRNKKGSGINPVREERRWYGVLQMA